MTFLGSRQYQTWEKWIRGEVRCPILNFFLLVLGVLFNSTPDSIHQSTEVTKTLLKESFELNPRQGSFGCLVPTLVLVPTKLILLQRNKAAKEVWLVLKVPAVLTWSLYFSSAFLVACKIKATGFSLKLGIYAELCQRLKVFFGVLGGNWGGNWTSYIARCGSPLFGGVFKSI